MLQIYKASAGSGKTFTLTREYIKYLIAAKDKDGRYRLRRKHVSDHSRILAITFTNKATNEMTRRIIKELALLAGMSTVEELRELGLSPDRAAETTAMSAYAREFLDPVSGLDCTIEELREASRAALTNLLYDYSYFNVSTIDSFFQSVLRMFTREVELPDNYNVELNNHFAISLGVDEMFNALNYHTLPDTPEWVEQRWVSDWLYQFMQANMAEGGSFNMFSRSSHLYSQLVKELNDISNEEFKRRLDVLRPYFAGRDRLVKFTSGLIKLQSEAFDELTRQAEELAVSMPADAFASNFIKAVKKLAAGEALSSDKSVTKVADDPRGAVTEKSMKKYGHSEAFLSRCRDLAVNYVNYVRISSEFRPLVKRVYIFGLLSTIMNHIDRYCRDNSLILLSETNNILKGLINDDETPFLYEKLGYYLDHFLIDEFQDTSPMQWENLKPLLMESLGRGKDDLVIGDEKQCIYRFRNSDPRLLGETVERDAVTRFRSGGIVDIKGVEIKDNSNWRSAVEVVKFNNTLFRALAEIVDAKSGRRPEVLSATETYTNIIQQIDERRMGKHGYVKVHIEPASEASADGALDFMTREMMRQFESGYRPGEIAVLVRGHDDGQKVISHLLRLMNDPLSPLPRFDIISEDAMSLAMAQSVRLIISILRLVSLPEFLEVDAKAAAQADGTPAPEQRQSDAYRRARLINRFQFYLHLTHPDGNPYSPSEALEAALLDNRTKPDEGEADVEMKSLLDMDCLNLPAVVERIIHTFVPEQLKTNENLFLAAFQDLVIEYSQRGNHDIKNFLDWWDKSGSKSRITSPADNNALTVMTIHKSKGLEFPCVHIPFADGEMFKNGSTAWVDLPRDKFELFGLDPDDVPPAMPLNISTKMVDSAIYGEACSNVIAQSRVDELNVNYVALTRPTTELIVYAPYKKGESFSGYLSEALSMVTPDYIDGLEIDESSKRWLVPLAPDFDGETFTLGSPTKPKTREENHDERDEENRIELRSYRTGEFIERAHACTQPDAIDPFNPSDQRHVGNFLHSVMSLVTGKERLDYAMKRQAYRFRLEEHVADKLRRRLELALDNPAAGRWFSGYDRVITERTVTSRGDTRRPDRLVWLPDGSVEVVDYKFVESVPESFDHNPTHNKYVNQVERYCRDVKGSTHATVRGYIWYIGPEENIIKETY